MSIACLAELFKHSDVVGARDNACSRRLPASGLTKTGKGEKGFPIGHVKAFVDHVKLAPCSWQRSLAPHWSSCCTHEERCLSFMCSFPLGNKRLHVPAGSLTSC